MHPALWVGKTGLDAQQLQLQVIANNLANVNTVGFKRDRASFQDLMYQTITQPGSSTSVNTVTTSGLLLGTGVKVDGTQKIHTAGSVQQTNNSLDIAINGEGYFQITMPDGTTQYTRNGEFQLDSTGQIVTIDGNKMAPAITIPQNTLSVNIGIDGTISALVSGSSTPQNVGQIQLAHFVNPTGLAPQGRNLFTQTVSSGAPTTGNPNSSGIGVTVQGSLESSNVNVVEELVGMIETQRAYEVNSKAIGAVDDMLKFATQTL